MTQRRFVGRRAELARLEHHLDAVRAGTGRMLSVRGRRQAGKSRLLTEFVDRSDLPQLFFTASRLGPAEQELAAFVESLRTSTLPGAGLAADVRADSWPAALRLLASALPDGPAIVVLDEFPWLAETSPSLEGALQTAWDRVLEARPVLLVLVGSDLAVMEALTRYERPLYGRAKELVVEPFTVADTAEMTGVDDPAVAIDAQLVTGGYPRLCLEWAGVPGAPEFVAAQLADEHSDLVVVGRTVLAAEFPVELQARRVLTAVGAGDRTNKAIATRAGVAAAPLARSLQVLREGKRVVAADLPVSLRPAREPRYRVADPYLRFWLRFVEPSLPDIARGRPDLALARFSGSWSEFRGRAVEPLVRRSLERLAADDPRLAGCGVIGGFWTRSGEIEVDLVGVDRWPGASRIGAVGSIKWRDTGRFDRRDVAALVRQRADVPGAGADAVLIAVSRSGAVDTEPLDAVYGPADLVAAWR